MVIMKPKNTEPFELLPFSKCFAGHETFSFRYSWLKKGVDLLAEDPEVFQHPAAVVRLGVGKNMVGSIRYWCLATRLAEEEPGARSRRLKPTELGRRLLADNGWDPFLEDDATLWLIHWNLASAGARLATWYWAFNRFHEYAFTRSSAMESLLRDLQLMGWSDISQATIKRDVDCFVQTYLSRRKLNIDESMECPLTGLSLLIQEPDSDRMRFSIGPKESLPVEIFAYALTQFWRRTDQNKNALELREIIRAEGSPGLVFKLDQESVLGYLDRLDEATSGLLVFEDTPLVRRVVRRCESSIEPTCFLEAYYAEK